MKPKTLNHFNNYVGEFKELYNLSFLVQTCIPHHGFNSLDEARQYNMEVKNLMKEFAEKLFDDQKELIKKLVIEIHSFSEEAIQKLIQNIENNEERIQNESYLLNNNELKYLSSKGQIAYQDYVNEYNNLCFFTKFIITLIKYDGKKLAEDDIQNKFVELMTIYVKLNNKLLLKMYDN